MMAEGQQSSLPGGAAEADEMPADVRALLDELEAEVRSHTPRLREGTHTAEVVHRSASAARALLAVAFSVTRRGKGEQPWYVAIVVAHLNKMDRALKPRLEIYTLRGAAPADATIPDLVDTYLWPPPLRSISSIPSAEYRWHLPVPHSLLPGVNQLHRISSGKDWFSGKRERTRCLDWDCEVDSNNARPPDGPRAHEEGGAGGGGGGGGAGTEGPVPSTIFQTLMDGQRDPGSTLWNFPVWLLHEIYMMVERWYMAHLETKGVYASVVAQVDFPEPTGININMMPFKIGDPDTIPEQYRQYVPLIACCPFQHDDFRKVGFLTITESTVEAEGESHRRGGVHTETPGKVLVDVVPDGATDTSAGEFRLQRYTPLTIAWGAGVFEPTFKACYEYCGGIFLGSNVADSTRIWNCKVRKPDEVVGPLGDIDRLRPILGEGEALRAGEIAWITDCTPHESLPLPAGTRRQFFRVVTSKVSAWYADHSTENPLCALPESIMVIRGSKFGRPSVSAKQFDALGSA